MAKLILTINRLCQEAGAFAALESKVREPRLYGVTDGKGIRTYFELKFRRPPEVGYLTVSNALQWRSQYTRVIEQASLITGTRRIR